MSHVINMVINLQQGLAMFMWQLRVCVLYLVIYCEMQCLCKNQGCARVINLVINFLRAVYTPISEIKTVCVLFIWWSLYYDGIAMLMN